MASIIANKEKTYRAPIYAVFFMLFGAILLAISVREINTYSYKNNNYIRTEAKVIKHTYKNGQVDSSILEYFVDEDRYTTSSNNKLDCIKSYGSVVNIKYNPDNPEDIIFSDRSINIVIPIMALVLLSTGLSITIVMLSDSIIRIKKTSRKINNKTNHVKNNYTSITTNKNYVGLNDMLYKNNANSNTNANTTSNNNNDNTVNIDNNSNSNVSNVVLETDNKEQVHTDTIIDVPYISKEANNQSIEEHKHYNSSNGIDYMQFISDVNTSDETLNFIPNVDILKEKDNN